MQPHGRFAILGVAAALAAVSCSTGVTDAGTTEGLEPPVIERVAFVSVRDGNSEIYVMDADGSNVTRLTHTFANDHEPAWSPDGSHIVFSSGRFGDSDIYVMDADGSNVTRLTTNPAYDTGPA